MKLRYIDTDVLVVGGGGAGLTASIEAREYGVEVLLASKMPRGAPNSSSVAVGWILCPADEAEEDLFRRAVEEGGYLNDQRLVEVFVEEISHRVPQLRDFGVDLQLGDNPQPLRFGRPARQYRAPSPGGLTRPLREAAESRGVRFMDELMITGLIRSGDAVVGATGLDLARGELVAISAKSVVLTTGGAACIYRRSDNPPGTTGDGFAMAYRAGSELVDMEFVTFNLPESRLSEIFCAEDIADGSLLASGTCHYFTGGVRIDRECRTTLEGLYAAGETAGGLFGAARLGGSALADIIVFGARAGRSAAERARRSGWVKLDPAQVEGERERLESILNRRDGISPAEVAERIKSIMWLYAGIIRTEDSLKKAQAELEGIGDQLLQLKAKDFQELKRALEVANMLDVARMVVVGALERMESRGAHWRLDHPRPDNEGWLKNIVVYNEDGAIKMRKEEPVMTRLTSPSEPKIGTAWSGYVEV